VRSNKHIAVITPGFPADTADTVCLTYLQHWVRAMAKKIGKENLVVFSLHYPYSKKEYLWNGVRVISLGGKNRKGIFRFFLWSRFMSKFKELHDERPFTLVQSFFLNETAVLAGRTGLPCFAAGMGQDVITSNPYHKLLPWKRMKFIAISPDMAAAMKRRFNVFGFSSQHARIIPFGVPVPAASSAKVRNIDVLGCGSFIPLKNYTRFIYIIAEAAKQVPHLVCKLAGTGPELESLKNEARKLGLENKIEFCGEIPQQELMDLMDRAKIFLHTSKSEGQGLVMGEALVHGCFVCTTVPGPYGEEKCLYKFNADKDAADKIVSILTGSECHCSASGVQTPAEVAEQYIEFYEQGI
jgi:glycosyltransferase involved in cell wall biosynthesis